ncbi:hypothetical protein NLJ89_g3851 [Agrocybe chaxingu]|uniref:Uncharacterized protein n=1 Tax=Agrocybe chaxingu TaxID=84603 RepID=A0A9W8K4G2_9AGAR|nr:hypothetical protein NLJ89_g3851 [Agrocybe chaxingu]
MATSTTSNNAQLKIILVQRAMKFVHDEFEDPLNSVVAARTSSGSGNSLQELVTLSSRSGTQWEPQALRIMRNTFKT